MKATTTEIRDGKLRGTGTPRPVAHFSVFVLRGEQCSREKSTCFRRLVPLVVVQLYLVYINMKTGRNIAALSEYIESESVRHDGQNGEKRKKITENTIVSHRVSE